MPFPSAGCQTCKNRRIKCDETQPVCQRCIKSRRTCYGMASPDGGTVIHMENTYASGQKKRPRGPRSMPAVNVILSRPLVDLKSQATTYYLQGHLQTLENPPNILRGIPDAFLSVWKSRSDLPILDLALSSMALAVLSRTQQHAPAALEASLNYQRLLRVAQSTISSLNRGNIDACLFAIFFMSRYEDATHSPRYLNPKTPFTLTCQSFSHHDGALAALRIWKHHLSHSYPATDVIKFTRRSQIRSALMRHRALPDWMIDGSSFGEHGLELEYDRIVVRVVNLRHRLYTRLNDLLDSQDAFHGLASVTEQLDKEARSIDEALQNWAAHFPSTWRYRRHTLPDSEPVPSRDFYSRIVYGYPSIAFAAVWNLYYPTRMLLNSTRLRVLNLDRPGSSDFAHGDSLECLSLINSMADDLASTIPFCLERFKISEADSTSRQNPITLNTEDDIKPYVAHASIWPLTIASGLGDVPAKQRSWFKSVLARLGRVVGGGVLECAESDQWLEL